MTVDRGATLSCGEGEDQGVTSSSCESAFGGSWSAADAAVCEGSVVHDGKTKTMAAVGGSVAAASAVSPRLFLRAFGIPAAEVTGAAAFGWRLFAVRTAYISALAAHGDATARSSFLPIQMLDQAVFWHAYATRSVPKRAALLASATSGLIIAADIARRADARAGRQADGVSA